MNIAALFAGLFSGILGSMGLGGGAVLVIYLSLFTDTKQLAAQGTNLLFFIPIAFTAVIIYSFKKQIEWKLTVKISLCGLVGAAAGIGLTDLLGGEVTGKAFGGLLVILGIREIFSKNAEIFSKNAERVAKRRKS